MTTKTKIDPTTGELPRRVTIGDKYGPAMEMNDEAEAAAYFETCVRHTMSHGSTRQEADRVEKANLGYYAGYYSNETRERVECLFNCSHPIFGSIAQSGTPTPEQALATGVARGKALR